MASAGGNSLGGNGIETGCKRLVDEDADSTFGVVSTEAESDFDIERVLTILSENFSM